jgi:asparagine synthetase B (glutamine-hydrolysing)
MRPPRNSTRCSVRSCAQHLRSDVPYGLFLSGGVDSAVLLAMISELTGRPVRTFSIGYRDDAIGDEIPDAAAIARRFGAEHTEIRLERHDVFRRLPIRSGLRRPATRLCEPSDIVPR